MRGVNRYFFFIMTSTIAFSLCLSSPTHAAKLSNSELLQLKKQFATNDNKELKKLVKEINANRVDHPLVQNHLRRLLQEKNIDFKQDVAETMLKLGYVEGSVYYETLLSDDSISLNEKLQAFDSLGETGSNLAFPILEIYENSSEPYIQIAAMKNLMFLGKTYDLATLEKVFHSSPIGHKVDLLKIMLGQNGLNHPIVVLALRDPSQDVSLYAFNELVKLEKMGGIDKINEEINNISSKWTQFQAELYLTEKKNRPAEKILEEYANRSKSKRYKLLRYLKYHVYKEGAIKVFEQIKATEADPFTQETLNNYFYGKPVGPPEEITNGKEKP